jgi:hypothetical protein
MQFRPLGLFRLIAQSVTAPGYRTGFRDSLRHPYLRKHFPYRFNSRKGCNYSPVESKACLKLPKSDVISGRLAIEPDLGASLTSFTVGTHPSELVNLNNFLHHLIG